jgi:hypothetical protein
MGNKQKTILILALLCVLFVGGKVLISDGNPPDDRKLIQEALTESITASKEGRPGGVMDKLSANIKVNDQNVNGNALEISRFIRDRKPDVEVENTDPEFRGDEATIVSPVTITVSLLGQSISRRLKEVTLVFKKEPDREFLIIPISRWKLAEVRVPEGSVADLVQ